MEVNAILKLFPLPISRSDVSGLEILASVGSETVEIGVEKADDKRKRSGCVCRTNGFENLRRSQVVNQ